MNENNEFDTTPKSEINATMAFTQSLCVMLIKFYFSTTFNENKNNYNNEKIL